MTDASPEILAAREKLRERFANAGRGRPKRRVGPAKSSGGPGAEERKVMQTARKMGLNEFPPMDDVVMVMADGNARVFPTPRVQAALNANTFLITGGFETKPASQVKSLSPDIDADTLKRIAEEWKKLQAKAAMAPSEDDIPDLVDNFENVD